MTTVPGDNEVMVTTYHGVVSGVRSKTGPSGMIMTHFNLRTHDGENRHIVAMREGRNKCKGVESLRDGIQAEITGTWSVSPQPQGHLLRQPTRPRQGPCETGPGTGGEHRLRQRTVRAC